ncbi:methionine synthase [Bacillus massiliglaciei]|uniref:methionine synthase n=1 Tax=Bacillus massiliglaciei TaxID=1816693 RepID=UPI000B1F9299|nr:methionine synthase [Bacillus massiliglaciei]
MNKPLIQDQMKKKILLIDGAMGTMLQAENLSADDFGGEQFEGCNEYLTITRPDLISSIHEKYLEAGADIIETNTFGATSIVLEEYQSGHLAYQINKEAAQLAKSACEKYSCADWPRYAAGSMGPTTKTLSVTGGTTFDSLQESYSIQAAGLLDGGVDLLMLETCQDMLNVKAAFAGIKAAFSTAGREVPLIISGTIEPMGTTLAGQAIDAFYLSCEHMNPIAVGLNCATGPEFMADHIRTLAQLADRGVSCYPNAGLPDEEGHYHESPDTLAEKMKQFAEKGWVNIIGGCCGTTPGHIKELSRLTKDIRPRQIPNQAHGHAISGIDSIIYDETMRPLFVGERTNVIGSRKFRELIQAKKFEEAAEVAREQVKNGAHVIDICLADPDDDELGNMKEFVTETVKKVKVPLVIDTTDEEVLEEALKRTQGKVIINSVNLEDGEERFHKVLPYIRQYGAAVVVGTIDEKGMAITAERKLEIARRSVSLLVNQGISKNDLIFDPLVFPVGTGDEQYLGSALETVKGIQAIKEEFPECLTILGISNVSFGLPPRGREILNAVFLYHCTKAGLDYAIVNTEKLERFASIPEDEIQLAEELLFHTTKESLDAFTEYYRGKKTEKKQNIAVLPLEERLARYIIDGTKQGLTEDLKLSVERGDEPFAIINGPLMEGMSEVGRLFNDNQLIVAEVLQSAEAMKAAVNYLEPFMESGETSRKKGKVLLATVKGDVHDIGKNLVEIILSNNGYDVIDLGIKVSPQQIIEEVRRCAPSVIGLSGLLVKSAQQMVITAQDLKQAGIKVPILVGGAALSRKFTDFKIASEYDGPVLYSKDAMDGLSVTNILHDSDKKAGFLKEIEEKRDKAKSNAAAAAAMRKPERKIVRAAPVSKAPVKVPADLKRHVLKDYPFDFVQPYMNRQMLIGHHLGLKGKVAELLKQGDRRAVELNALIDSLTDFLKKEPSYSLDGVYQFFPAQSEGDKIIVYHPENGRKSLETFEFPRQSGGQHLCLADYLQPVSSGTMDYVGFFTVTAGKGIREWARNLKQEGDFLKSHAIQSLALETAEAFAERVHHMMRDAQGIGDPVDMTMKERFAAKYIGQRFSFGYPACPNLEDQQKLFNLLKPDDIGIKLTEGFMMEPEASVSAIVFAHPEARYFNIGSI